jgi:hypothetical protein
MQRVLCGRFAEGAPRGPTQSAVHLPTAHGLQVASVARDRLDIPNRLFGEFQRRT